ncbi:hypothetical protein NUW58_g3013 [Xylaria curta]|uniref:Uncharacterized protein n=1 Tax=Xylaria curta TaxID=42375 RepID=A0ACC1PFJ7_9PEZI|nr:hypothetical protein NUW58_g3013 [Xylaria curta]
MRATLSTIALCAIGASAAAVPSAAQVEARQENAGTWYLVGFEPSCGTFGCNSNYAVVGAENAVPGAPAFGLRCNTWSGCSTPFGTGASARIPINQGPLVITHTFTSGGKTITASATVDWNGNSLISKIVPVTVTTS